MKLSPCSSSGLQASQLVTAVQRLQGGSSTHVLLHAAGTVQQLSAL